MVAPYWRPEAGLAVLILPSAYLLLLLFTLKIYFLAPIRSSALSMVLSAVILLLVADLIHAHGVTTRWYEPGTAVDLLWFAVYGLLERLQKAIPDSQTVSVGVTSFREGDAPKALLERADAALYRAKEGGRDRIVVA